MSNTNKGKLGRGLDSLLPKDFNNAILNRDERIQKLFIADVKPNPNQPRKQFDEQILGELADSIKQYGVLQPIIVSPLKSGGYQIIAGERRWRAAQLAGLSEISAIVREKAQLEQLEIALIENVQRVDLSPLEQAASIGYLHEQFNLSFREIARKLGKAAPTVNNIVRLLNLPPEATEALRAGRITEGHARAILALKATPELQSRLLQLIESGGWSVRQAEQFVTAHKEGLQTKQAVHTRTVKETPETKRLAKKIGSRVTIHHTARGGRLEIHFKNDHELDNLFKKLV
ncbi:MAG TPA: ParB/RepB/Spo0J family partition protein [Candidatus Limnocylindrales bacterium]|nr:ParB/RepB/Spo0J family partition protein [Candidatus Limnocylindrales bacterium]